MAKKSLVSSHRRAANRQNSIPAARPHLFTIVLSIIGGIGVPLAAFALYWNMTQPDIRYIPESGPEVFRVLENKPDSMGNFIYSIRIAPTFINESIKPGFIDKVEFVPLSIATLPDVKITSINKTSLFWHRRQRVEILLLLTITSDISTNMNTTRQLAIDQVLAIYDNTGRKVDHLENGLFGRIHFNFKEVLNIKSVDSIQTTK